MKDRDKIAKLSYEEIYKSWKGKTIEEATPLGPLSAVWGLKITFTDGTGYSLWQAQDAIHVEKIKT